MFSSPHLVANERNNSWNGEAKDNSQKGKWFYMWWSPTVALFLSLLTDYFLVLCSASVLVTTGTMKWYLQSNQVAQVVQLLQDGIHTRK